MGSSGCCKLANSLPTKRHRTTSNVWQNYTELSMDQTYNKCIVIEKQLEMYRENLFVNIFEMYRFLYCIAKNDCWTFCLDMGWACKHVHESLFWEEIILITEFNRICHFHIPFSVLTSIDQLRPIFRNHTLDLFLDWEVVGSKL